MGKKKHKKKYTSEAAAPAPEKFETLRDVLLKGTPDEFVEFWVGHPELVSQQAVEAMVRAQPNGGTICEVRRLLTKSGVPVPSWIPKTLKILQDERIPGVPMDYYCDLGVAGKYRRKMWPTLSLGVQLKLNAASRVVRPVPEKKLMLFEFLTVELMDVICNLVMLTEPTCVRGIGSGSGILEVLTKHILETKFGKTDTRIRATDSFAEKIETVKSIAVERMSVEEIYAEVHAECEVGRAAQRYLFVSSWPRKEMGGVLQKLLDDTRRFGSHAIIIGDDKGGCLEKTFYESLGGDAHVISFCHKSIGNDEYFAPHQDRFDGNVRNSSIHVICYPGSPLYGKSFEEAAELLKISKSFLLDLPSEGVKNLKVVNDTLAVGFLPNYDFKFVLSLLEEDDPHRDNKTVLEELHGTISFIKNPKKEKNAFSSDEVLDAETLFKDVISHLWSQKDLEMLYLFISQAPQRFECVKESQQRLSKEIFGILQSLWGCIAQKPSDGVAIRHAKKKKMAFYVTRDKDFVDMAQALLRKLNIDFSCSDCQPNGTYVLQIPTFDQFKKISLGCGSLKKLASQALSGDVADNAAAAPAPEPAALSSAAVVGHPGSMWQTGDVLAADAVIDGSVTPLSAPR